jgi:hypothetical protein
MMLTCSGMCLPVCGVWLAVSPGTTTSRLNDFKAYVEARLGKPSHLLDGDKLRQFLENNKKVRGGGGGRAAVWGVWGEVWSGGSGAARRRRGGGGSAGQQAAAAGCSAALGWAFRRSGLRPCGLHAAAGRP